MKLEKNRHVIIVQYIINSKRPCTSEELAEKCNTSSRTIKSDMGFISDVFKENGAMIVSKKSEGYSYIINDQESFDKFVKNVYFLMHYYVTNADLSSTSKLLFIIRRILSSKDFVKIDDIAYELFISRSAMKQEMLLATEFLASYHITLISKAGHGIQYQASEDNLRLCMLACFGITYHNYDKDIHVVPFGEYFNCNEEEYQAERRIMLHVLREVDYHLRDDSTQNLARYFVLMKNRMNSNDYVSLDKELVDEIRKFKQYTYASEILSKIDSFFDNKPNEQEIAFVAIQLLCYQDYKLGEFTEANLLNFYEPVLDLNAKLIDFLRRRWGIFVDEEGFKSFLPMTSRYVIRSHFKFLPHKNILINSNFDSIKCEPLSIAIAQSIINYYGMELDCDGIDKHVLQLAYVVFNQLRKLNYEYKKLRLITCSGIGRSVGTNLVAVINNAFGQYIESNKACELYEVRGMDRENIDYVIIDNPRFTYNYDIPSFRANRVSIYEQLEDFYREVVIQGFLLDEVIDKIASTLCVYRQFNITSIDIGYRLLAYKHGKSEEDSKKIYQRLSHNEKRLSQGIYSNFNFMEVSNSLTHANVFEIYKLMAPLNQTDTTKIKYMVFLSYEFSGNQDVLLAINHILKECFLDENNLERLVECDNRHVVIKDIIQNALKKHG